MSRVDWLTVAYSSAVSARLVLVRLHQGTPPFPFSPSTKFDNTSFRAAIDGCLDGLSTVHKGEMETLMTHRFQMFEDVPLDVRFVSFYPVFLS